MVWRAYCCVVVLRVVCVLYLLCHGSLLVGEQRGSPLSRVQSRFGRWITSRFGRWMRVNYVLITTSDNYCDTLLQPDEDS